MASNTYASMDTRTKAWVVEKLLENTVPHLHIQNMSGQDHTELPQKTGDHVKFRRYLPFVINKTPLVDGTSNVSGDVAQNYQPLTFEDFDVAVQEYGMYSQITEKAKIMVEDNLLGVSVKQAGIWAGKTSESLSWDVLSAATAVFFTGGATSAATVAVPFTINDLRNCSRFLVNNDVEKIGNILTPSTSVATVGVEASYMALMHPDLKKDLRNLNATAAGKANDYFTTAEYPNQADIMPGEEGKVEDIRFVSSTLYVPIKGGGATVTGPFSVRHSTVGGVEKVDLYNIVVFGKDAYNCITLKGANSADVIISPAGVASPSDPFAHLQTIAVKIWQATLITNPRNICRLVTASAN